MASAFESIVGTTTIVRCSGGMPSLKSSRGNGRGCTKRVASQLTIATPRWAAHIKKRDGKQAQSDMASASHQLTRPGKPRHLAVISSTPSR